MRDQLDLSFLPRKHLMHLCSENRLFSCSGLSLFFPAVAFCQWAKIMSNRGIKDSTPWVSREGRCSGFLISPGSSAFYYNNTNNLATEVPLK